MRHFQMSVYTQLENMKGNFMNPPPQIHGAWSGVRNIMRTLAEEITKEGTLVFRPLLTATFIQCIQAETNSHL